MIDYSNTFLPNDTYTCGEEMSGETRDETKTDPDRDSPADLAAEKTKNRIL